MSRIQGRIILGHQRRGIVTATMLAIWLCSGCAVTADVPGEGAVGASASNTQAPIVRGQDDGDGLLGNLDPRRVYDSVKRAAGYGPNQQVARKAFEEAEKIFVEATSLKGSERAGRFLEAAKKYDAAADRWPDSTLHEDALFMRSESYFFADRYPKAATGYEELIKHYPNTRHMDVVDRRRFDLARFWIQHQEANPDWAITPNVVSKERPLFDKFGHGVRVLDKIRFDDPTGKLADDATMAAAVAQFKAGKYVRADELFEDLRRSFPNSEHQFQAHLLGVKCKLKTYQGPQYSRKPMDDAENLLKQIRRQFPQEASSHQEFLTNAWKEVRMNKALHDWSMAKYYDRRQEYAAARHYYRHVRDVYSDTSLATDAAERLTQIAEEPGKPDDPLPWLSRLFPTPDREKPLVARNPLESLKR
jgi:outer membrane protein assembly factor BamD (BamD/ComL family)